jgi:hypothetical protein
MLGESIRNGKKEPLLWLDRAEHRLQKRMTRCCAIS